MPELSILINKSEITAGTRGSSLGPEAIMIASVSKDSDLFSKYRPITIKDRNHAIFLESDYKFAKRVDHFHDQLIEISTCVSKTLGEKKLPVVLAGDHGSAAGTIAGIQNHYPDKRLGVIWVDAHADLHSPYSSPSGNMHGMPLAIALKLDQSEGSTNKLQEKTKKYWEKLKGIGNGKPIHPQDLVFIGLRSYERAERLYIENNDVKVITVDESRRLGLQGTAAATFDHLKRCDILYISFDVDCMDPKLVSYGTGTPVENGFSEEECLGIVSKLCEDPRLVTFEIVEVNPCLDDKKNRMAEAAFHVLSEAISAMENLH